MWVHACGRSTVATVIIDRRDRSRDVMHACVHVRAYVCACLFMCLCMHVCMLAWPECAGQELTRYGSGGAVLVLD